MSDKAYVVMNQMVVGPNFAPFSVFEGFSEHDLCGMLNECHDYAMRLGDTRIHEVALEREQARTERNYERRRRLDDEGVWLETRDANRGLREANNVLAKRLRQTEKYLREVCHYATGFISQIEQQPEFGPQPKYGNGLLGMTWRVSEEAMRYLDRVAQWPSGDDPVSQEQSKGSGGASPPIAKPQ